LLNDKLQEVATKDAYHPARYYGHLNGGNFGHPFREGEFVKE
jgi:hypothetical protein